MTEDEARVSDLSFGVRPEDGVGDGVGRMDVDAFDRRDERKFRDRGRCRAAGTGTSSLSEPAGSSPSSSSRRIPSSFFTLGAAASSLPNESRLPARELLAG